MQSSTLNTTVPQQEIWMAAELGGKPALLAFQDTVFLDLKGTIDEARFIRSWETVVRRHGVLNSRFSSDGLRLEDTRAPMPPWTRIDVETKDSNDRGLIPQVEGEADHPLDLVNGPLFRTLWIAAGPHRQGFILTVHQLVCDRASQQLLLEELAAVYKALLQGTDHGLVAAPPFAEYVERLEQVWTVDEVRDGRKFWAPRLSGTEEPLDLPTDFRRPPVRSFGADSVEVLVPHSAADSQGGSSFLAATAVLVSRLGGQTSFALGYEAAGQRWFGLEGTVGHCVHTAPLAVRVEAGESFGDLAGRLAKEMRQAESSAPVSLRELSQTLSLPRDPSRVPLTPVGVSYSPLRILDFGQARGEEVRPPRRHSPSELAFEGQETKDGLVVRLTFLTELFDRRTADAWVGDLACFLTAASGAPGTLVRDLPPLSEQSRHRLFADWNPPVNPDSAPGTALGLIEGQAARTPSAPAVRDAQEAFSYRQLDEWSNALAIDLVGLGVVPGDLVGVCVGRSARMVVALLGIWKAGAAYVPLDPDYPRDRLSFIAEDSELKVLVTERPLADIFSTLNLERLWLEDLGSGTAQRPPRPEDPGQLAYILHTSGSTGKPKGVQIEHRSLVNFLGSFSRLLSPGPEDCLVATTTLSFDIAGLELYLPLCTGAQVFIATRSDAADGVRLSQLLHQTSASLFQATPSTWHLLVEAGWRGPAGFQALCGGEAFPPDLAKQLLDRCGSVWNVYGPTETTIWSTVSQVIADETIPAIGRPIANTTVYLVDQSLRPVPVGAAGELLIGGLGVARGYLNRPELTQERFVTVSFRGRDERVYRTGDLCRFGADGRLHFLRRNDGQVKVRGFRIELGEIDSVAGAVAGIRQTVTQVGRFGENDQRLVCYYTVQPGCQVDPAALKSGLQAKLPGYMVPQHYRELGDFPLTPNGKIDRKALVLPPAEALPPRPLKAPRTAKERTLLSLWKELLKNERLGIDDAFFDVGGHSLLAAKMTSRIRDTLSVEVTMRTVFEYPTVEALAAWVETAQMAGRRNFPEESVREEAEF